jgi:Tat protein secretion system quality control protein TatD with DNase activity
MYVVEVAKKLAELKKVGLHKVSEITNLNALKIYGLANI